MATCRTVATTAPSQRAPNSEYSTVYRNAGPKSYGPACESSAIIQPPATNNTKPTKTEIAYAGRGQLRRGLPYRQVSGSFPHITEPIAMPTPVSSGSVEPVAEAVEGRSVKPLTTR